MDTNTSHSLFDTEGISYASTYLTLSGSNKTIHSYRDVSDDACGAQLSQEYNGLEFPIAFLLPTFMDTQRKWSTTEQ